MNLGLGNKHKLKLLLNAVTNLSVCHKVLLAFCVVWVLLSCLVTAKGLTRIYITCISLHPVR